MSALYVGTSALGKLVTPEAESTAMHEFWSSYDGELVSSDLARTELRRHAGRCEPSRQDQAGRVLAALTLIPLLPRITEAAGRLGPPHLRSLDALHLATALELGDDLEAVVTYDRRQADAARQLGLRVVTPGTHVP